MEQGMVTPVLLAGGKSSRMGTNKAFVSVYRQPMIERVISVLESGFTRKEMLLVTNTPEEYFDLGIPLVEDVVKGKGPLGGLQAALLYAKTPYVFLVGCDMPFIRWDLIAYMISRLKGEAVLLPRIDGHLEPLHALYAKSCLAELELYLQQERPRLNCFLKDVTVAYLEKQDLVSFDPLLHCFSNINTREELIQAELFCKKYREEAE